MLCIEDESTASTDLYITLQTKHQIQFSLLTERIIYHLCHRNISDPCIRFGLQSNVEIGGRSGFIFNTKHGRPLMPAGVNSFLKNIVNAYNKKECKLAEEEKREPELMPPISSHTLRHTGCTRLGENNVNPKVMQYVMGHSDAQITMNVYNHIAEKSHVENEMSKMNLPETIPAVV